MSRTRTSQPVQMPGAAAEAFDSDHDDVGADGANQGVSASDMAAELERLKNRMAMMEASHAAELAQAKSLAPQVVVTEPETPHGIAHKRASKHLHLTSAQLQAAILAGEMKLGPTERTVLCKDGWFIDPGWTAELAKA